LVIDRDYQESWQPALISDKDLYEAQDMAEKLLRHLVVLDFWSGILD
jgi:formate-dependent phosphoribosylglycinamide formyltransferase (GAR transformylase)